MRGVVPATRNVGFSLNEINYRLISAVKATRRADKRDTIPRVNRV